ncbi:S8 family serine peptidase [Microbacterium sp. NPDC089189]|uniref:S8 family serine peptidase n=1 Tax=Microbacterium sp. NPDC089189 TaxID=3154972 RepID=UPI00342298B5
MSTVVGAGLIFGGSGAVADDEPAPVTTLADALASAAADGATDAAALAASTSLPATGPGSLTVDASGAVQATVTFASRPDVATLDAVAAIATLETVHGFSAAVTVVADPQRLPELAALPGVVGVAPVLAPATSVANSAAATDPAAEAAGPGIRLAAEDSCRAFGVDADEPLRSALARETFDVDGTGVTVGIISDSYESGAARATTPAEEIAAGLLPGPGNPCGYTSPVEVLVESTSGGDEGRGMAQLVHGVAPGSRLLFASGNGGTNAMADSIIALADAGADIIVDDLGYAEEPRFQQGLISAAITEVQNRGVAYYSAVGNDNATGHPRTPSAGKPIAAWQTMSYRPIACPEWVEGPADATSWDCLDFDPGETSDPTDTLSYSRAVHPGFVLSWGEAVYDVTTALSLQVYSSASGEPELIAGSEVFSSWIPNALVSVDAEGPAYDEVDLVVVRDTSAGEVGTPAVWIGNWAGAGALTTREHNETVGDDLVGAAAFGHAADGSTIGVAAADWRTPTLPESYSSPGPGTILFEPMNAFEPVPSAALPAPLVVAGPEVASVDGNRTSFFGQLSEDGVYRFFGTSAAAPNAAAVHALAAEYAPGLRAGEVTEALLVTARAMENPFPAYRTDAEVFGAGLVDANALLEQLPPRAVAGLEAEALSPTSIAVSWDAVAGATAYRVEVLAGDAVLHDVELDAEVTATTFDALTAESSYTVRVTAIGASAYGPAASVDVSTPRPAVPGTTPAAPTVAELGSTPAPGLVATPATVAAGGTVTVTGLPSREYVYGWFFSDPTALGWAWTGADGAATVTVPASVPAGAHRLAFRAEDGTLLGWVALQVTAAAPAPVPAPAVALARTGQDTDLAPVALWAAAGLLVGAGLTVAAARRRAASRP